MGPRFPRVSRFVDAVANGQIGTMQTFAAPDVNHIRIRNRHRDGADRTGLLIVKDGLPGPPVIGRLENAAVDLSHVEYVRLRGDAGDRVCSTAAERSDVAPSQGSIKIRIGGYRPKRGEGE